MSASTQSSLRIYWLTEAFYPPDIGGQEMFAAQLVQEFSSRGVHVSVITRQSEPRSVSAERIGLVNVRRMSPAGILKGKGWKAFFPILAYLTRLLLLLLKEVRRYDVLIVSGIKVMPLIVVPLCLVSRKKCILRVESFFELQEAVSSESLRDMSRISGRVLVGIGDRVRKFMLRRAGYVIAISTEIRTALQSQGVSARKILQIPNAVDLRKFRPVSADERLRLCQKLSLPTDRTLVLYAGRLSRAKGVPMLIEAWPALVERYPDLCLLVVGSGRHSFDDCEGYVTSFVRTHRLENHVRFFGESDCVHEFLQAAHIFVLPTEYEGFSLALIEALACGVPVAVTSVGAAPDLIQHGHNGFLFPPKNVSAMLTTIELALEQRDRWSAIGSAARESVIAFDLSVIAAQYIELCRELMRNRPDLTPVP